MIANIKLLWAVLGPDNPFFLCALDFHSLPEEVGGKTKKTNKKNPPKNRYMGTTPKVRGRGLQSFLLNLVCET